MRPVNKACIDLIKSFEGFSSKPYPDPGTGAKPYTIGYGTTRYPDGKAVTMQDTPIIEAKAVEYLVHDIEEKASAVEKAVRVPLNENEYASLVSFTYNIGVGAFQSSTLLRLLNAGTDRVAVADQLLRWTKAGGKELPGLVRRRQAERSLFLQPVTHPKTEHLPDIPTDEDINAKLKKLEDDLLGR